MSDLQDRLRELYAGHDLVLKSADALDRYEDEWYSPKHVARMQETIDAKDAEIASLRAEVERQVNAKIDLGRELKTMQPVIDAALRYVEPDIDKNRDHLPPSPYGDLVSAVKHYHDKGNQS